MAFGAHILSENLIVVPSVLIASLKLIGIHGKKGCRYEQEIEIYVDLICKGVYIRKVPTGIKGRVSVLNSYGR